MKRHHLTLSVLLTLFVGLSPCLGYPRTDPDLKAAVGGNTRFALELYQKLRDREGNLFLSPYSISTALAMTYAGARENTARQMAAALHFSQDTKQLHAAFADLAARLNAVQGKGKVKLHIANSLWPQKGYPILNEYRTLIKKYYGIEITPVDYKIARETARRMINAWVEKKTEGRIRNMIPPGVLDALTSLVLVNAIYFKGNWASQFNKTATQDESFHLSPNESVKVPMMKQERTFRYAEHENLQILELPYTGNDLSMVLLLPKGIDGIPDLEKALTSVNLEKWLNRLHDTKVSVLLPRFKMTSQFRLGETLKSMGMTDALNPNKADFSGMDGNRNWLYIGAVLHKAFVEVNEEGTEAAAATAVAMKRVAMPPPPPTFRADHPFLFMIRDNGTGSILFMGRVADPTKSR